jgi:hypothetical protein
VKDRGRAFVVVTAVAVSAALVAAPIASGAGDPIKSGKVKLKLSKGFKKQLKRNHVRMTPKKSLKIKGGSTLDPTTGAGLLRLGKITFKKGAHKYVVKNVKMKVRPKGKKGNVKGSAGGGTPVKLFTTKGGKLVRNGFGAKLNKVKLRFEKGAAKKINKDLELDSLHKGSAGKASASEQPKTVAVTGGFAFVDIPIGYLPATFIPGTGAEPNAVAAKQPAHCLGPGQGVAVIPGSDPANPARLTSVTTADPVLGPPPSGMAARFRFPVVGGDISPSGTAGAVSLTGGIRLQSGQGGIDAVVFGASYGANCQNEAPGAATSLTTLETSFDHPPDKNIGPNLALQNIQTYVTVGGQNPGCTFTGGGPAGCTGFPALSGPGFKGPAIGQVIDPSGATVTPDATAKTVTVAGGLIKINGVTASTLNAAFPNGTNPVDASKNFADGDKFGISTLAVNTR